MKKLNLMLLSAVVCGLFLCPGQISGQNIKSLVNKVTENETVKKTVNAIKTDETVKSTVEAVKTSVQGSINAKIDELKNPKPAAVEAAVKAPAQALAPEVKNSISEVRALTGLTQDELNAKMKALGYAVGTDDLKLGGTVYKSKTAGTVYSVTMGTRNGVMYVREAIKATVSKKANLATAKSNFLKLGTQTADLKASFTTAGIAATAVKGTRLTVQKATDRTTQFIPALDKFTAKKENGTVTDAYAETDYTYELKMTQTTVKALSTVVTAIKVTDLSAE